MRGSAITDFRTFLPSTSSAKASSSRTVGFASLSVSDNPLCRHEGLFGIMVRTDWQGRGIGRKLIERIIDLSDNWLNLKRIELVAFADNCEAIRFYESYGFEREALLRANMTRSGSFCDSLVMSGSNKV